MNTSLKATILTTLGLTAALLCAAPSSAQQSRNIRIATNTAVDHPLTVGAQKFADLVNQKSQGRLKAKVYPGATLGPDVQVIGSLQGGIIDASVPTVGLLTSLAKEYNLFLLPGVFHNVREADAMLDGAFAKRVGDSLLQHKLVVLTYLEHGFKHITNNKRPINKWEDLNGLKIRVTQTPLLIDTFKALGTNPVPMSFPEVYSAAEQGAIDGLENTVVTIDSAKFYEVQKNLTLSSHMYDVLAIVFSKPVWDKLSADERKILSDSASEARTYQRKFNRDLEKKTLADMQKKNIKIVEMSEPEKARMRERLKPVSDKYAQAVGESAAREFSAELEKVRKSPQ